MKPIIRCSSLARLLSCHGSQSLIAKVAPREGSESHEGSFLHWQTAKTLVEHLGAVAPQQLPAWPTGVPKDYVLPRQSQWLHNWFVVHARESLRDEWSIQVECELRWEFPNFILIGHHDVLALSPDASEAHGIDWKAVYNAVPVAPQNNQVLGYLVLERLNYGIKKGTFDIVQPRVKPEDGDQVSRVTLNEAELDRAVAYLEDEVNKALADPMTLETGISQCAWCPAAMGSCLAIDNLMKATIAPEYLAALGPTVDDTRLADFVTTARILTRPIKDAEELIRERLETAGRINGTGVSITMEKRGGQYSVTDGQEIPLYDKVHSILPKEEVAHCVRYSTEELRARIAKVRNVPQSGKQPVTGEKIFAAEIKPHLTQSEARIPRFA